MTPFQTDIYTANGEIDIHAVEQNAKALRAQATRDAFVAIVAFFKGKTAPSDAAQNA